MFLLMFLLMFHCSNCSNVIGTLHGIRFGYLRIKNTNETQGSLFLHYN